MPRTLRNESADFLKAILIWMVIFGHSIQFIVYSGYNAAKFDSIFISIYIFHMPLFMAVSGYFVDIEKIGRSPFISLLEKRARQLLLPMAAWVVLGLIVAISYKATMLGGKPTELIKQIVSSFFNSYWFLWATFFSYLLLWSLAQMRLSFELVAALVTIVLLALPLGKLPVVGHVLNMTAQMFPYFVAGTLFRKWHERLDLNRTLVGLCVCGAIFLLVSLNYPLRSITFDEFGSLLNRPGFIASAIAARAAASCLVAALIIWISRLLPHLFVAKIAKYYGTVTLQIYLFQGFIFEIVRVAMRYFEFSQKNYFLIMIVSGVFSILTMIAIRRLYDFSIKAPRAGALLWGK